MKKIKLSSLDEQDGFYYVGHLIDIEGNPWVEKDAALEIIGILNAEIDALEEYIRNLESENSNPN